MNDPPKRYFWQIRLHLSNLMLLVLSAGVLMAANFDVYQRFQMNFLENPLSLEVAIVSVLALVLIAVLLEWGEAKEGD
jgi:hypothetical protein